MKILVDKVSAEIVEKKSRFIADIFFVLDEKEAEAKLSEIKKKNYDAKHHCFAYILGEKQETVKSSDDGEPSGTAGHPILDILKGAGLTNVIAIVTRYFGGTLLGTGGLVSAYSSACKEALKKACCEEIRTGYDVDIEVNYDDYNKIKSYISKTDIKELKTDFAEKVKLSYMVEEKDFDSFSLYMKDLTKGHIILEKGKQNGRKYIWKNLSPYYLW